MGIVLMAFTVSFPLFFLWLLHGLYDFAWGGDLGFHLLTFLWVGKKDEECAVGTDLCCQVDSFPKVSFQNPADQPPTQVGENCKR